MTTIIKSALILSGLFTRHDAFDTMTELPPLPDNSYHYVTADDCDLVGETGVMVVYAKQYNVIVGDCAQKRHIPYRTRMNYVSDVEEKLWRRENWPDYPIPGTLYLFLAEPKQAPYSGLRE